MGIFDKLNLSKTTATAIEWDMTPDLAFCTFSAKGLREELSNTGERVCYFFIDNWGETPRLYLMERGTRHVNILAEITAPLKLLTDCIVNQGGTPISRDNFPIDSTIKDWLRTEVIDPEESPYLIPAVFEKSTDENPGAALPPRGKTGFKGEQIFLPIEHQCLDDDQMSKLIVQGNFYDAELNPQGKFNNYLADGGNGLTVIDERTDIMWQLGGLDLCSRRSMQRKREKIKAEGFAGYQDWRLPTVAEALSLMEPCPNEKGIHLHPCFSKEQPFIFVAARRKPTGYWFVDYKQGKVYWSSGSVPGGFARLCRRMK
jgi:hypothetical protein